MTDRDKIAEIIRNARMFADPLSQVGYAEADALIANGVIVLPCKVGDTVYTLCGERFFDDSGVEWVRLFGKQHIEERTFSLGMMDANYNLHSAYFLTKEEAEQALKEREGK